MRRVPGGPPGTPGGGGPCIGGYPPGAPCTVPGGNPPPAPGGKRIKLRYITQASIRPPRFVVFGTRLDMLPKSYERYLVNGIRDKLGFDAVPVRVVLKSPKNPFQKE